MDLRNYMDAIRKFWWALLAGALLGALAGVVTLVGANTIYEGSVTFFVKTTGEGNAAAAAQADQFAQRRVNSYAVLLKSDRLAELVAEDSGLDLTPRQISRMLEATGGIDTVLLTATVEAGSEEEAAEITESISTTFPELINQVEGQGIGETSVLLEVVSGPTVREVPPRRIFILGSRTVLGLLVGLAAAVLLKFRDSAVSGAEEIEDLGLGPVLASIPLNRSPEERPLILPSETHSQRAEAYRHLRTNLQFLDAERPVGTVVVTSATAGEGKSVSAANLALSLEASDADVLLVEADLRRPGLSELFDCERSAGLTDVLVNRADFDDVVQPWGSTRLSLLPSGPLPPNPSELLGGSAMAALMEKLCNDYDVIVLDAPPILPVSDALILAAKSDGAIVVARSGRTNRQDLSRAVGSLHSVKARMLGVVLTFVPSRRRTVDSSYPATHPIDSGMSSRGSSESGSFRRSALGTGRSSSAEE